MGKGYHNYMSKKFFHPSSFENIKRKWIHEQKHAHAKQAEEETLAQYQKEQEMYQNRALLGDEKAKLGLNFMYDPPPGVKRDREKEEDEPEYKFEWQRKYNAPREGYAKGDDAVRDQPFGIEVRNVRCLKCRKWGHINTDKVCPLYGNSITAEPPASMGANPGELMDQMADEGLAFTKKVLSRQNDPEMANQQLVDSDADADEEIVFFMGLTRKEKKKLVKKLEKERKRKIKERKRERKSREEAAREKQEMEEQKREAERIKQEQESEEEVKSRQPYKRKRRLSREVSEEKEDEPNQKQDRRNNDRSTDYRRDVGNGDRHRDREDDRPRDMDRHRETDRHKDNERHKESDRRDRQNGEERRDRNDRRRARRSNSTEVKDVVRQKRDTDHKRRRD